MPVVPILDLPEYRALTSLTSADETRDKALQSILNEVNDALRKALRQPLESAEYTEYYDAPPTDRIPLKHWPVTEVETVKVAAGSNGDPSKFIAGTAWEQYTDWILEVDQSDGSSRSAVLRSTRGFWGVSYTRPIRKQAARVNADYRAVQVVYTAGYEQIPYSLKSAAMLMTSRLWMLRRTGQVIGSASLNGASYSVQAGGADGLISDPKVQEFLTPFMDIHI